MRDLYHRIFKAQLHCLMKLVLLSTGAELQDIIPILHDALTSSFLVLAKCNMEQ